MDLVLVGFGWLLGLLSPRLIDAIAKRYRRDEIKRGLREELIELRVRLAMLAARVAMRNGTITRDLVKWQLPIIRDYKGFYSDPKALEMLTKAADMTDAQLQAASALLRKEGSSLGLKKFRAPFLEAHLADLHLFPIEVERQARELEARLCLLNEDVDQTWYFFTKTFDTSLDPNNLALIRQNLEDVSTAIGPRAKALADGITRIVDGLG
jgi:hypothetical protein